MDSLPNTSAASAVFQEEPHIPLDKFPSPVKGSFNGGAISRTEPPAQKFGTQKPSQGVNGKFIAELMSNPNLSDRITSFFIKDPKVSEYAAKGAQLFQELKTKYPDQLIPLPLINGNGIRLRFELGQYLHIQPGVQILVCLASSAFAASSSQSV